MSKLLTCLVFVLALVGCTPSELDMINTAKTAIVIVQNETDRATGTGTILEENYIITNSHVVGNSKEKDLTIRAEYSEADYPVEVVWFDKGSDLALLKLKNWNKFVRENEISIMPRTDEYDVGEKVYTIGHAWNLYYSVSTGIISHGMRQGNVSNVPRYLIQTDANVFQGNSGGPLINTDGELVAVNVLMYAPPNAGGSYGFSIPNRLVEKVEHDMEKYGEVRWARLEAMFSYLSREITDLNPTGPAARAGVHVGDKIIGVTIDGVHHPIRTFYNLIDTMAKSDYQSEFMLDVQDKTGDILYLNITPSYVTSDQFTYYNEEK